MKQKGFTLVELLAVIVILSLLVIVAIPSSQVIGDKIKDKLLATKLDVSSQAAVLWSQDNLKCFTQDECSDILTEVVCRNEVSNNFDCYLIKLESLAEAGYLEYDDEEMKIIENPKTKTETLNDYTVILKYNIDSKIATGSVPVINPDEAPQNQIPK